MTKAFDILCYTALVAPDKNVEIWNQVSKKEKRGLICQGDQ